MRESIENTASHGEILAAQSESLALAERGASRDPRPRGHEKMADSLTKYGVYIDDLSKIRVLEPEAANQTVKLKEECQSFVSSKLALVRE